MRVKHQTKIPQNRKLKSTGSEKKGLHPRNRHQGRYDFNLLVESCPELSPFISKNKFHEESIDFANPKAVKTLNRALLKSFYGISKWDIPTGYLCPPIPGRADYLHYIADLLSSSNGKVIPRGELIRVLDIGVGANCIYPLIGHKEYGWSFLGSDTDSVALACAKQIVMENDLRAIEIRLQKSASNIFIGLLEPEEKFDLSICNPPFHASLNEAQEGSRRKWKNLDQGGAKQRSSLTSKGAPPVLNFGGQGAELWCAGGERAFVCRMIEESALIPRTCFWFSSLISKESNLKAIYGALKKAKAFDVRTINMAQGQKKSRIVAWTFLNEGQQEEWRMKRWRKAERKSV
jgi:23S rRNA (adenine1618-N6)-methyltransferase